ncbi:tubulin-like doman-containing protein [Nocardiopsis sp. CC223A]|uniref:tubulin-like doman-containing protein n=1 Tax=Nocardiopsis sp. CC223A TaxID=3044051 RepID=UPI00278BC26B|nr:tubulin-like doman-containing protein [Nocardiopsis sp. CC223A]
MAMKLYQPLLHVGLGGTGCRVGAELERRMREELCGPDGTEFQQLRPGADLLPYQLPACTQFVYADVNRSELDGLPELVVPGRQHLPAVERTAHYVRDLVPEVHTYPEAARSLRLSAGSTVESWLPPADKEPRVAPLDRGAGQFPTVGRAALFETFRGGVGPAVAPLRAAISRIATSAGDLAALGGSLPRSCDVFVSFSVAGGTGAGIFYDYLHLISHAFEGSGLRIKIYPLILMPSAFDEGFGGGRNARLNAGRALLDMFRLVDDQNSRQAELELVGDRRRTPTGPDDTSVVYPVEGLIRIPPSTVQTAFLFSRPTGTDREDLHRSVSSLILALAGTDIDHRPDSGGAHQENHQSFADSFINNQADRESIAETGIGNRGVSTSLVASLTVPVDELSDIIGSRLLRSAVEDMQASPHPDPARTEALVQGFFSAANLHPLLSRPGMEFAEPPPATGAREIGHALYDRLAAMKQSLEALRHKLSYEVPELAQNFDHRAGVRDLLTRADPFHALRIINGDPQSSDPLGRTGVLNLLQQRRNVPEPPEGTTGPPPLPELRDRLGVVMRLKYTDPPVAAARADQDRWYDWRTRVVWAEAWSAVTPRWSRSGTQLRRELNSLTQRLEEHARTDHTRFERLSQQLYRPRTGISYLLPPSGRDLEPFFVRVRDHLIHHLHETGRLHVSPTDAELVQAVIGPLSWRTAFDISLDRGPGEALGYLRETLKSQIKRFLRDTDAQRTPLLPRLADLLTNAAGQGGEGLADADLARFRSQIAGLLPVGYTPQGNGPLKLLITYHSAAPDPKVENYLRESLNLPQGAGQTYEFRAVSTESVSVVLFRSSMSITEVPEVRDVLRLWDSALDRPQAQDYLPWRQRLGHDFAYLATTEEHRVHILHRLLNALWNGRATASMDDTSPTRISFTFGGGVTMPLELVGLRGTSSWGSLIQAYERWAFNAEDGIANQFSAQLMAELPHRIESTPEPPDPLFTTLYELARGGREAEELERLAANLSGPSRTRALQLRDFWTRTLPAALRLEFRGVSAPAYNDLQTLFTEHSRWKRQQDERPPQDTRTLERNPWGPAPGTPPYYDLPYERGEGEGGRL